MGVFCYSLRGVLRTVTPLHVGSGFRTGVIKHCRTFIPGSFLRGAVGTALIRVVCRLGKPLVEHEKCEHFSECAYAQLFGEEFGKSSNVFFRYAYPLHLSCGGVYTPAAQTVYRCSNPQCRKVFNEFVPPRECPVCGFPVKPFNGYQCDRCGALESFPIKVSRITLTAVDRVKLSAAAVAGVGEAAGTLHTLETIAPGSRFNFEVIVDGEMGGNLDLLRNIIEKALPDEGVGGAKSRGFGKVAIENLKVESVDTDLLERRADEIDAHKFRVRLLSPLILDGKVLDSQSLLEGVRRAYTWAFRKGKPSLPELSLKNQAVRGEPFSGWSLKTGRRRKVEPAVSAGSVFEFECSTPSRELALGLPAIEYYAIGAYKPHGCGQLRIEKPTQ